MAIAPQKVTRSVPFRTLARSDARGDGAEQCEEGERQGGHRSDQTSRGARRSRWRAAGQRPRRMHAAEASAAWIGRARQRSRRCRVRRARVRRARRAAISCLGDLGRRASGRARARRRSPRAHGARRRARPRARARSRARSAFSVSACELTDTYSPAAIDIAPATRPATPGDQHGAAGPRRGGDADHEARRRDDAVVRAEHGRAQPADTA